MTFTKKQQKTTLMVMIAVIVLINGYRIMTEEKPRTAPLVYTRGVVAGSPVRQGLLSRAKRADPLNVFASRQMEQYPGVARDIFSMENPVVKPKKSITPTAPLPPPVPEPKPQEIAADQSRADLAKFRFLGYLTDKESTLFLSKDDELFIVKKGDVIQQKYQVKEAKNDYVVLLDVTTGVELRVELPGGDIKSSAGRDLNFSTGDSIKSSDPNQPPARQKSGRIIHRITRPQ